MLNKRALFLILALAIFGGLGAQAQIISGSNATKLQGVPISKTAPSNGTCLVYNSTSGKWEPSSCSGTASTAWASLTSGTNTGATMVVGTGASLGAAGSGTIAATSATALAATPAQCTSGQFATGVAASGNANCASPAAAVAVGLWQGDVLSGGTPTTFTASSMALFYWDLPSITADNIGVSISAGGTAAFAVCIYPFTGTGNTETLVAEMTSTSWTAGDGIAFAPITGGAKTITAGAYLVGFDTGATTGITFNESGGFNGVGEPTNYANYTFLSGQTGTCPASIIAPTLSATFSKVTWFALSSH